MQGFYYGHPGPAELLWDATRPGPLPREPDAMTVRGPVGEMLSDPLPR